MALGSPISGRLLAVYLVNATVVICHEIGSAYWSEWELFRIPGGASVFVALHLIIIPLLLIGLVQIAQHGGLARVISLAIGGAGLLGTVAHLAFLASGDPRFRTRFSIGLIAALGVTSLLLILAALRRPEATQV